jgi:hypothetical protein
MPLRKRLGRFCLRLSTLSIVAGVLLSIPDYDTESVLRYKNAVVAFVFVVSLGKLLYDTFFYDRFNS